VFKTVVLMHISSNFLNVNNEVGVLFVDKGGLQLLIQILDERLSEDTINWKIMERLIQCFFVLACQERNVVTLRKDNIIKRLVDALVRANEARQVDTLVQIAKVLTFFSRDEQLWSQIICRDVVRGCIQGLATKDRVEKKFLLSVLYGKHFFIHIG
jgi:hypothetical protein